MKKAVQNIDKTLYVRVGVCMQAFVYKSCTCVCVCVRPPWSASASGAWDEAAPFERHYSVPALQCVTVCVHVYTRRISSSLHALRSLTHLCCPSPPLTSALHTQHAGNHLLPLVYSSRIHNTRRCYELEWWSKTQPHFPTDPAAVIT